MTRRYTHAPAIHEKALPTCSDLVVFLFVPAVCAVAGSKGVSFVELVGLFVDAVALIIPIETFLERFTNEDPRNACSANRREMRHKIGVTQ